MSTEAVQVPAQQVARPGFWRRQFADERTAKQRTFDIAVGIVGPSLLVPMLGVVEFSGTEIDVLRPVLAKPLAATQIVLLALWMLLRARLGRANALFAGAFLSGAAFAFLCGIALLPLSAMALLIGIGLLGFAPFATSFAFVRACRDAWTASRRDAVAAALAVAGAAAAITAPIAAAEWADAEAARLFGVVAGDAPAASDAAVSRLRLLLFLPGVSEGRLLDRFAAEQDETVRARLGAAYLQLTDRDAQSDLDLRND